CKWSNQCRTYYEKQSPDTCTNELNPPLPAGGKCDPHFTCYNNYSYTFNGYGEYVLFKTSSIEIQIQLEPIESNIINNHATVIQAFVIKNANYPKVQFELFTELKLLEIRVNNRLVTLNVDVDDLYSDEYLTVAQTNDT
ncbi:unnamed protein product, partial [Didymodactylos carnosus]